MIQFTADRLIILDQFRVWGTDNKGVRHPVFSCFSSDWNEIRAAYLTLYPTVVCIEMQVAVPDLDFMRDQGKEIIHPIRIFYINSEGNKNSQDCLDWFDFADWVKQRAVMGKPPVAILDWEYVRG